jgi:2-polyprenyl-3-methyl-5-hydroxy-6-metoxy-1,4-benzoquinol methylase
MPNYGDPKYWDKRYKQHEGSTFDWLEDFTTLKPLIIEHGTKDAKILMLGCGNACLSEDMYNDGYTNIYNIDISQVVID